MVVDNVVVVVVLRRLGGIVEGMPLTEPREPPPTETSVIVAIFSKAVGCWHGSDVQ